jgi:hypothetical protein
MMAANMVYGSGSEIATLVELLSNPERAQDALRMVAEMKAIGEEAKEMLDKNQAAAAEAQSRLKACHEKEDNISARETKLSQKDSELQSLKVELEIKEANIIERENVCAEGARLLKAEQAKFAAESVMQKTAIVEKEKKAEAALQAAEAVRAQYEAKLANLKSLIG